MKASEALSLSRISVDLNQTVENELKSIYTNIEEVATSYGGVAYHYYNGCLTSESHCNKVISEKIISNLKGNGYVVECKYSNPNKPWLLISWSGV